MAQLMVEGASGFQMPAVGLGTWRHTGDSLQAAVHAALEAGYHLIDTAYAYGNEALIGEVLSQWFSAGKLKREDIFITTKLPTKANNPKLVKEFLEKQLKALQVEYVDLYLIHHPCGISPEEELKPGVDNTGIKLDVTTDHVAIWKEMEKQVDSGLTKAIGLSNFNVRQIERVLKAARIPPVNLQIELYLYNQAVAEQEFCRKNGMTLTSYGSLGSQAAPTFLLKGDNLNPLKDPVVVRIAEAHGKTPSQVLLRHLLQLGIAVIPKSGNPERIRQNIQVFDFKLSDSEMDDLNGLNRGEEGRRFLVRYLSSHPEYPYPR